MVEAKKLVKKVSVLNIMAAKFNLDSDVFLNTIKATVMKPGKDGKIPSNEEIAAFLVVANKYNLDPFTNEIYAFPSKKGGIIPIVGVDGFTTIMNRQANFNGYDLEYSEEAVTMDGAKSCPEWAEVKIYHKDREHPTIVREYLDEVYVPARGGFSGPWQTHTKRMLRHKALIQGIRVAFGITGIYDPDEADRILDAQTIESGKPVVDIPQELPGGLATEAPVDPSTTITVPQKNKLFAQAKGNGYTEDDIHKVLADKYGVDSVMKIQREWFDSVLQDFSVKKAKE